MKVIDQLDSSVIDAEILKLGEEVWHRMQGELPGLFNAHYWHGRILDWVMRDPDFKVDLFRFVDVLPVLQTTSQVAQHVRAYLLKDGRELPGVLSTTLKAASHSLTAGLAARAIKKNVAEMAARFIVGQDAAHALAALRALHAAGIAFTVDLLGEATVSDAEAAAYQARYFTLLDTLANEVPQWPADNIIDTNHLGAIPRTNVSLKLSALDAQLDAVDPVGSVSRLKARVLPLFLHAREKNVFVNVDLEHWQLHGLTYDLFEEIVSHRELRTWPHVGIVVQAYLKSAQQDLERLISIARARGAPITVRLVKGAYWDYEVVQARQHGYPCPVLTDKASTDANYEQLSAMLLEHLDALLPAFGSHNLRSLAHAIVLAQELQVPKSAYELQMLYGMAEPQRQVLRAMGHRVRVYGPVGELLPGMAYLIRRLLENTANSGFLRLGFHEGVSPRTLLARPQPWQQEEAPSRPSPGDLHTPFENCPQADFTDPIVRQTFAKAIDAVTATLPLQVPVVVAGQTRFGSPTLARECPSDTTLPVASVTLATPADADTAIATAARAWPSWRDRPLAERAMLLEKLAQRLQQDRFALAALQTFEVGKPWREADADVAEAIDFCRYYARQALVELGPRRQGHMAGEDNVLFYEGRGPTVVIAPWNFPLAILCGMATAALVAGNTVVLKPAEQASAVAYALYTRLLAVGFPPDVVHFLPGVGEEIGRYLVAHPHVAQIAFTGSKQVGLAIVEQAAKTHPGQPQVKRVVCEMGGKNAIIVDDDADLDEAVAGVLHSAFGYAGQKCSACSRAVVVGAAYAPFVARLVEACRSLTMAPAHLPACRLGPVIDAEAYQRLHNIIAHPGDGATPLYIGEAPRGGWYVAPAVFAVQDPMHRLMQEELFGPVLAVLHAESFDAALTVAVSTEFALTGSVYSRTPSHLEEAARRFRVGNLYLNRGCTGALVHRQPFGGFGMSGLGTKAGGLNYLLQFADPRCVSENTMRRGFSPEVEI
jgi:RHH-type transcriptional regulator, proline utilization regulon repressor / proline dehydrogenase / delta 1-pyrroline-5-carboxylate dehydrogenase